MSAPLIYVDLIEGHPAPREKFPSMTETQYREMVDRYQPWRLVIVSGWVTAVPGISRNDQLRIIGNGVVVMQAVSAFQWLLNLEVAA